MRIATPSIIGGIRIINDGNVLIPETRLGFFEWSQMGTGGPLGRNM